MEILEPGSHCILKGCSDSYKIKHAYTISHVDHDVNKVFFVNVKSGVGLLFFLKNFEKVSS